MSNPGRLLRGLGAGVIGLIAAAFVMISPTLVYGSFHGPDPRSAKGILTAIAAAGIAIMVGAIVARLTGRAAPLALGALVASLGLIGVIGVLQAGEFGAFLMVLVQAPGCVLGGMLTRRFRRSGSGPAAAA